MAVLEVEVALRQKNQLTLPEAIAKRLGAQPGDRLIFELDEADPRRVHVRLLRRSYAGALEGIYGETPEEVAAYIQGERESWGP
ncbi:MAG: AbrB/MazE/SpoVT family DNA-binding domain-containing protein [Chloroflexi bacterium]|nr:AbrB/MazE/SpoVT family DNA-binding domain-containing protein [Chloroflexota bacterium]